MRNKYSDLNNHLFSALERLNDEDLSGEDLIEEIGRAKAITDVAEQIIANGNFVLKASIASQDSGIAIPLMIEEKSNVKP